MLIVLKIFFVFSLVCTAFSIASRVLELSDRFLDIHKEGQWLVMMYAPWCAHCKRLEPIWAHVAQVLYASPIRVGKIDCHRFSSVKTFFEIQKYPTIFFLKGEQKFVYNGDRTRDDIVTFAQRLSGPPVQEITKPDSIDVVRKERSLHFLFIGEDSGPLWEIYYNAAIVFQEHAFFYQSHPKIVGKKIKYEKSPTLVVYKENTHYAFNGHNISNYGKLNETLYKWINAERFPTFPKVTYGNINQLFLTNKNLVLAVVEENQLEEIPPDQIDFKIMLESVIRKKRAKYHDHFQFGWVGNPDLINRITAMHVPLPSLIVINTTTHHHHFPEDEPESLTPEVIELFLANIRNETAYKHGGNSIGMRIFRSWFEIRTTLVQMWKGNPILTLLIFGMPAGFLALICWQGVCCPDFIDEEEEGESDDSSHMKKD